MKKEKRAAETALPPSYTPLEELLNACTHGIGAGFGIVATIILLMQAAKSGDVLTIVSAAVYGISIIILYTMSMLYHAISNKKAKKIFRIFDHSTIFLLIAGTYTPYSLVTMRDAGIWGYLVFFLVWAAAIFGIILNCISVERFKKISLILYIASGWAAVIAIKPLLENLAVGGLILMLLGGVFYTGGIVFYKMKSKKYFHSIWHVFVLAGSVAHFFSILFYVYQ